MAMSDSLPFLLFLSSGVLALTFLTTQRRNGKQFPPGPQPLPLLGNLFDVPALFSWLKFTEWQKIHGDLIHVNLLGHHLVVINSREIARELLDKRSRIYSSRPSFTAVSLAGWDFTTVLMPYGDLWRQHRSAYAHVLRPKAVEVYQPLQLKYARILLRNLLDSPERHADHLNLFAAAVIMDAAYGHKVKSVDDHLVEIADEAVAILLAALLPGSSIMNIIPIFAKLPSWFPGAEFKKKAARCRDLTYEFMHRPLDTVKEDMEMGRIEAPSMASILLERYNARDGSKEINDLIMGVTATNYAAGLETTVTVLSNFLFAIRYHPEVQERAQQEIISVIGQHRLPTFDDRKSLPYIEAIYRETMRCHPAAPVAIPHFTTEDDSYKDYSIPSGTMVIANIWAMTHDEEKYPDPFAFKPERFLKPDGTLNDDDEILAFGFGRRICVGRYFASNTVWAAMASILCAFNISSVDGGKYPTDSTEHFAGTASNPPKPFTCKITPRDTAISRLVQDLEDETKSV